MRKAIILALTLLLTAPAFASVTKLDCLKKDTPWKEIRQQLSPKYELVYEPAYSVDFGAIEVKSNGETLFALLTSPAQAPKDNTTFSTLMIESPSMKTKEGIGVGSLISDAVKVYGPVELSYNVENESREFAVFANGPKHISFRTGSEDEAGIYEKGSYSTKKYKKDAKIKWLIVTLQ